MSGSLSFLMMNSTNALQYSPRAGNHSLSSYISRSSWTYCVHHCLLSEMFLPLLGLFSIFARRVDGILWNTYSFTCNSSLQSVLFTKKFTTGAMTFSASWKVVLMRSFDQIGNYCYSTRRHKTHWLCFNWIGLAACAEKRQFSVIWSSSIHAAHFNIRHQRIILACYKFCTLPKTSSAAYKTFGPLLIIFHRLQLKNIKYLIKLNWVYLSKLFQCNVHR